MLHHSYTIASTIYKDKLNTFTDDQKYLLLTSISDYISIASFAMMNQATYDENVECSMHFYLPNFNSEAFQDTFEESKHTIVRFMKHLHLFSNTKDVGSLSNFLKMSKCMVDLVENK
jgi:hypothetical protein